MGAYRFTRAPLLLIAGGSDHVVPASTDKASESEVAVHVVDCDVHPTFSVDKFAHLIGVSVKTGSYCCANITRAISIGTLTNATGG